MSATLAADRPDAHDFDREGGVTVIHSALYFQQQVYVTRQGYEGFVPIPTFAGVYQSLKAVRWTGK